MKYLIVNADDFGLAESINRGIIQGHTDGIITSTTVMAVGNAFESGMALLKQHPQLGVGVHLTLDEEVPLSPPSKIPHLVTGEGKFLPRGKLLGKLMSGGIPTEEIRSEWFLQMEKTSSFSVPITHIDSHGHLHLFPSLSKTVMAILKKFKLKAFRGYSTPWFSPFPGSIQGLKKVFMNLCGQQMKKELKNSDIQYVNFRGMENSGHLDLETLKSLISKAKNGVTEIMTHPGWDSDHLEPYRYWQYQWEKELAALQDPACRSLVEELDIKLVHYGQLAGLPTQ